MRCGRFVRAAATDAIARIVDAGDRAIVTVRKGDIVQQTGRALEIVIRPAFRITCTHDAPVLPPPDDDDRFAFVNATRALAAELEAGFRSALLFRPDPDHDASLRARYGVPPIESEPLRDGSIRFAVGHASATLRPDDAVTMRLTCTVTTVRGVHQTVTHVGPRDGATYGVDPAEVERLAFDMRAFLAGDGNR